MKLVIDENIKNNLKVLVQKNIPVILYGKPGVGKTSLAYEIAGDLGYQVIEINASDERTKDKIEKMYHLAINKGLIKYLLLFDEVDGAKISLTRILKNTKNPVILTANNLYKIPEEIRNLCEKIHLKSPRLQDIVSVVRNKARSEGIDLNQIDFSKISHDVRNSLKATLYNAEKYNSTDDMIFDIVRNVFTKGNVDLLEKKHLIWLLENIENFYQGRDIYEVANLLAKADWGDNLKILTCLPKATSGTVNYPYFLKRKVVLNEPNR